MPCFSVACHFLLGKSLVSDVHSEHERCEPRQYCPASESVWPWSVIWRQGLRISKCLALDMKATGRSWEVWQSNSLEASLRLLVLSPGPAFQQVHPHSFVFNVFPQTSFHSAYSSLRTLNLSLYSLYCSLQFVSAEVVQIVLIPFPNSLNSFCALVCVLSGLFSLVCSIKCLEAAHDANS